MRPVTYAFLYAEAFDFLTTGIALSIGCVEQNPMVAAIGWIPVILIKIGFATLVAWVLENRVLKFDWIYPILAIAPVIWNASIVIIRISHL
jgi:hypothetical protein